MTYARILNFGEISEEKTYTRLTHERLKYGNIWYFVIVHSSLINEVHDWDSHWDGN